MCDQETTTKTLYEPGKHESMIRQLKKDRLPPINIFTKTETTKLSKSAALATSPGEQTSGNRHSQNHTGGGKIRPKNEN
jgi:hypothetical protein